MEDTVRFDAFVRAVRKAGLDPKVAAATSHTSAVMPSDWQRIETQLREAATQRVAPDDSQTAP